jgi:hypothetical protein
MFLVHAVNVARYFNKWGWIRDPVRNKLNARTLQQIDILRDKEKLRR